MSVNAEQWKAATATFKVYVNGEVFKPSDIPVLVVEGRTMLPLKAIGDALDLPVKWDSENKRVLVGGKLEENPATGDAGTGNIGIADNKIYSATTATFKVYVNGEEFKPDNVPVLVVEGRTMLPLKAIGDALGVPVKWDSENKRVLVGETVPEENNEGTEVIMYDATGKEIARWKVVEQEISNVIVDGNLKITILNETTNGTESIRSFEIEAENTSRSKSVEFSLYEFGSNIGMVCYYDSDDVSHPNFHLLEPSSSLRTTLNITNASNYNCTRISYNDISIKVDVKTKTDSQISG